MNTFLKYPARISCGRVPTVACLCFLAGLVGLLGAPVVLSIPSTVTVVRAATRWDASATGCGELRQRVTNHRSCAAAFNSAGNSIKNKNDEDFESWFGEMIPYAKISAAAFCFTPDIITHTRPLDPPALEHPTENISSTPPPGTTEAQLIYAVDDAPELTELYTILLEATGYIVRPFNDRAKALTALKAEGTKPDLLITDCVGPSMSLERFLDCCLGVYPSLRILMVSGYSQTDVRFPQAGSDRFIQKPFTIEEFLRRPSHIGWLMIFHL